MAAEGLVLGLLESTNRPYNVQLVSDMLATKGVKKAGAEKALEALVEKGKVVRKEFGKTKIFWPSQEGLAALSPEEAVARQARLKAVQEEAKTASEAVAVLRKELAAANSTMTIEQLHARVAELSAAKVANAAKLAELKGGGARLVSAGDVQKAEKSCLAMVDAWARHRRQFRAVWDAVSEGLEGKEESLFEEIGIDSDKMVGADLEGAKALVQPPKKVRR